MIVLRVNTCVTNLFFDACHYTPVDGVPTLHGHTFRLSVCVEGEVSGEGWVIDFSRLRAIVEEAIRPFKYSLIIPVKDRDSIGIKGGFRVKFAFINATVATGENIGLELCGRIREKLSELGLENIVISLDLWEGSENFVRVIC